jgi:uncharacterized protein YhbP (UPF0306 family)
MTKTTDSQQPTDQDLRAFAGRLILAQNTMTLATARDGIAWAAPVYYANIGFLFYFFSDPGSRHIQESMESGQASASIFSPADSWQGIRGVQMSGVVSTVSAGLEALRALRAYLKKYPFTKEFFDTGDKPSFDAMLKKFRVKLYRFQPRLIYYLDNQIRFGFRESLTL